MRNGSRLCQVRCRPHLARGALVSPLTWQPPPTPQHPTPTQSPRKAHTSLSESPSRGAGSSHRATRPGFRAPSPWGCRQPQGPGQLHSFRLQRGASGQPLGADPRPRGDRKPGSRGARRVRSPSLPVTGPGRCRPRDLTPPPKTYLSSRGDRAPAEPARLLTVCAR